jgi:hypothetical protein
VTRPAASTKWLAVNLRGVCGGHYQLGVSAARSNLMRKASRRLTLRADRSDFFDCAEYGGQLMRTHGRVATGKSVLVLATEYGARNTWPPAVWTLTLAGVTIDDTTMVEAFLHQSIFDGQHTTHRGSRPTTRFGQFV